MDQDPATLERLIQRLSDHDDGARRQLFEVTHDRLLRLTRKMLKQFPGVRRWEQTDDVWQNAGMRLWQALERLQPTSVAHFFSLAALNIRRELIDLLRHYYGAQGIGANQVSHLADTTDAPAAPATEGMDQTHEASHLAVWTEFHRKVEELPEELRTAFDLLWYQGLTQEQAAHLLNVSVRTVKRRWQSARLALYDALDHRMPTDADLG